MGWRRAKRGANPCFVDEAVLLHFVLIVYLLISQGAPG